MWPFKKKKIYKVEYKDEWNVYGCCVVKAYNEASAWRAARIMYLSSYTPTVYINITELHDA